MTEWVSMCSTYEKEGQFHSPSVVCPSEMVPLLKEAWSQEAVKQGGELADIVVTPFDAPSILLDPGGCMWLLRKEYQLIAGGTTFCVPAMNFADYLELLDREPDTSLTIPFWGLGVMYKVVILTHEVRNELRSQLIALLPEAEAMKAAEYAYMVEAQSASVHIQQRAVKTQEEA